MYANDFVLCIESEGNLRAIVEHFIELCRSLKVNAGKSKVMVLGGEEGLECEFCIEHVSEFLICCVLHESGTNEAECSRKVGAS